MASFINKVTELEELRRQASGPAAAPVREIAHAPDTVLLGDVAHEGVDLTDVRVYVRRGAALLLVTSEGAEPHEASPGAYRAITVSSTGPAASARSSRGCSTSTGLSAATASP